MHVVLPASSLLFLVVSCCCFLFLRSIIPPTRHTLNRARSSPLKLCKATYAFSQHAHDHIFNLSYLLTYDSICHSTCHNHHISHTYQQWNQSSSAIRLLSFLQQLHHKFTLSQRRVLFDCCTSGGKRCEELRKGKLTVLKGKWIESIDDGSTNSIRLVMKGKLFTVETDLLREPGTQTNA